MQVGFVGLGIIGPSMALNLIRAGTRCACTGVAPNPCSRWSRPARPPVLSLTAVPGAALAAQAFQALFACPGVRWDSAAILKVVEEMSGFPRGDG